ncbi:kinase-like protein [Neolentinus lepideus HHB14362 ss-1]|uniref:Kinase-like protein n=1 Tax=Neolentinus lepideus HHB14362 ss-1 TaxID=1314782 RepID=A0A165SDJ4_9AGAM|nr:kinase-like protein [Neolentinus lepideus HHB14362 ss-1]
MLLQVRKNKEAAERSPAAARPSPGSMVGRVHSTANPALLRRSRTISSSHAEAAIQTLLWQLHETKKRQRGCIPHNNVKDGGAVNMDNSTTTNPIQRDPLRRIHSPVEDIPAFSSADEVLDLTDQIEGLAFSPVARGGFADVYAGIWVIGRRRLKVAIKVLRPAWDKPQVQKKIEKRLKRELGIWRRLQHKHILPLYGIADGLGHVTSMVCPWKENGTLSAYIELHYKSMRCYDLLGLLCQVASGLSYLHGLPSPVVHGDLTGSNVLIDEDGIACLCDFGLSIMMVECEGTSSGSTGGALRWTAPELVKLRSEGKTPKAGKECDIYSFGSVTLQVLSGRIPYHYLQNIQILWYLINGTKPVRPVEADSRITDTYWEFIQRCWTQPEARPNINEVLTQLQDFRDKASESFS